jgi:hypothetical protein
LSPFYCFNEKVVILQLTPTIAPVLQRYSQIVGRYQLIDSSMPPFDGLLSWRAWDWTLGSMS